MHTLVVGSSVIDLFLKVDTNDHAQVSNRQVTFELGDKIPVHIRRLSIGGNGANVSVGLQRLGVSTTFFTYLGSDILSQEIEQTIQKEGVELLAQKEQGSHSSLSLIFSFVNDRIIFSHHETRNYEFEYKQSTHPDYIYLTAIGTRWEKAYKSVLEFVESRSIPLAFSPGSYQLDEMGDLFFEILCASHMVCINKEEAIRILTEAKKDSSDITTILRNMQSLGPSIVSITDGEKGAYAINTENTPYKIGTLKDKVVEKTGAGDAYAAGFLGGYMFTRDITEAMRWGTFNAASIMRTIGAQTGLLTREEMKRTIKDNSDFKAEILQ